ncbi:MAG: ABC transporter substrate-binding protein [Clostridia bacterium]|nr:ABC transporter substrate-binding protein [Clostridia bacterium]
MQLKRILTAALALCLFMMCGCERIVSGLIDDTTADPDVSVFVPVEIEDGSLYFKDFDGNEIVLNGAPSSVASLSPIATEIIIGIGAGRYISVIDSESAKLEGAPISAVTVPYYFSETETVKAKAPQIIFYSDGSLDLISIMAFKNAGMTLIRIPDKGSIATAEANIRFIAAMLFREAAGERIVTEMREEMERMRLAAEIVGVRKTVYIEGRSAFYAYGGETIVSELCACCGADNVFTEFPQNKTVTAAQLVEKDPEVVIILTNDPDNFNKEEFRKREGVTQIYASRTKAIYALDMTTATRPTQNIVKALSDLGKILKITK